jgi:hypothetical protein
MWVFLHWSSWLFFFAVLFRNRCFGFAEEPLLVAAVCWLVKMRTENVTEHASPRVRGGPGIQSQ